MLCSHDQICLHALAYALCRWYPACSSHPLPDPLCRYGNAAEAAPEELAVLGGTEKYVEYDRMGRVVKGQVCASRFSASGCCQAKHPFGLAGSRFLSDIKHQCWLACARIPCHTED